MHRLFDLSLLLNPYPTKASDQRSERVIVSVEQGYDVCDAVRSGISITVSRVGGWRRSLVLYLRLQLA